MSLGLPEFGSRGRARSHRGFWRAVRIGGLAALAYTVVMAAIEWRAAYLAGEALDRAKGEVAQALASAEDSKRSLQKNPDLLVAATSVESSPDRVLADLDEVLPEDVSLTGLKIDYQPDATTHLDFSVTARTAEAYDRFLAALSKSPHFSDIRPGAESRPGQVRATLTANHRPKALIR